MPKIGVDVKNFALYGAGISNSSLPLLQNLMREHQEWKFILVGPEKGGRYFRNQNNCDFFKIEVPKIKRGEYLYNFTVFPWKLRNQVFDLFYSPYFDLLIKPDFPTIITIHDLVHFHLPILYRPLLRKYLAWALKRNSKLARHIVTVSDTTKRDIIEKLKIPEEKITVIYNSISEEFLEPPKSSVFIDELKKNENFRDKTAVLYSGGVEHRKNIIRLLKAVDALPDHYLLVMTGEKTSYQRYDGQLAELQKRGAVYLSGRLDIDELRQLYHYCDLIIYPSLYEGFGFPIIEAMAVRKPIACSHVASLPEIGGDYPIYFDPYSISDIARAIIEGSNKIIPEEFEFPAKFRAIENQRAFNDLIARHVQ